MSSIYYPVSRPRFSIEQVLLAVLIGLLLFGFGMVGLFMGSRILYAGRIFPGVSVAGVDVSGMRPQEAEQRIMQEFSYPYQGKILLRDGDRIWKAAPAELGMALDPHASAQSAYAIGRSGWILDQMQSQFYAWYSGRSISPNFIYDERVAFGYLSRIAKDVNKPTVEASLELHGTDVVVLPGQVGRSLNIPKSLMLVSIQMQSMRDGVINLVIDESSPVILDASKQAETARAMLSQPLTLTLPTQDSGAGPWTIDQQTLASMLAFNRVTSGKTTQYEIGLNNETLREYLANVAPTLTRTPQNARFTFNDDTHQLELIQSAVIGRELNIDATLQAVQQKLYAGEHSIPLAINYSNPPVTDQSTGDQLGIHELIHTETSFFYGSSASRVQNIQTAASKFHGLLVGPGETFSMASALGDITLDNGYAEALIIIGGQTLKGVGGGVCQVSTTLFRTVFFSGFPIVERHPHAYRVYYYEKVAGNRIDSKLAGLDATVFVPLVDFKFTNDTKYWLLMETYVNPKNSSITWKFYSTSDNRRVDWKTTGPINIVPAPDAVYRENPDLPKGTIKQVDWAAEGADVTVDRTVYRNDAVYLQDTVFTHYEPWKDVFEYGPGTDLPPDAQKP